ASARPDVVLLQETKTVDDAFPRLEIEDLGYNLAVHGQKSYNGVAILSKHPIEDIQAGLPGNETDEQARYLEATIAGIRLATIYLPNGNPAPGPKYDYKLDWMAHLLARAEALLATETPIVLAGDYNVIPTDEDVHDAAAWAGDALIRPATRALFRRLLHLGYSDAFRVLNATPHRYSFWDYQGGAWQKDQGIRIDHLLLSPQAVDCLTAADIDQEPRGKTKASDHTPVWVELVADASSS
ncbi:MAG: exodeoxyribonuclease III, partial [Thalassobaculaceae bacterium]